MIDLERQGKIAIATLNRAPVNAIHPEWMARFHQVLDAIERDPAISVLHIRSAHKVFCAGYDIAWMRDNLRQRGGPKTQIDDTLDLQNLNFRIARLPKVVLCEIGGAALGGGFELALSGDLRIAADEATIGLPEANLGQVPGAGGTQRLTRLCGPGVAARLILGCESVSGAEARQLGMVQWSVPKADLPAKARAIAERVATFPVNTLAEIKGCIAAQGDHGRNGFDREMMANHRLLHTPETVALIDAFLDRPERLMLDKLRRIVTGHDAQGRSVVLEDAVLAKRKGPAARGVTEVWSTDRQPIDSRAFADPVRLPFELIPKPGGSKFLFFAVAPESADGDDATAKARAAAAFASYGADAARPDTSISPWMHKTKTIDYIIVLKGEVTLLLEGEERTLKPFDVVIQRGTNHAWINRGTEPALLIAILIDADYSG